MSTRRKSPPAFPRFGAAVGMVVAACSSPSSARPSEAELDESPAHVTEGTQAGLATLAGEYRFSGGAAEREALAAAVEEVVADMNVIARPIARSRLLEANAIAENLTIDVASTKVTVEFDGRVYSADVGGPAVEVTGITGDALKLTHRADGKRLLQHFKGPKGGRNNKLSRSGDKLRMHVAVTSDSLPKDLVYDLTFTAK